MYSWTQLQHREDHRWRYSIVYTQTNVYKDTYVALCFTDEDTTNTWRHKIVDKMNQQVEDALNTIVKLRDQSGNMKK